MGAQPSDDLYALLGVAEDVDARTLRAAYLARMRVHHPDRQPADAGRTARRLNLAYEVLRDPLRRAEYDRARRATRPSAAVRGPTSPVSRGLNGDARVRAPRGARSVVDPAYSEDNQRYARDLTRTMTRWAIAIASVGLVLLLLLAALG